MNEMRRNVKKRPAVKKVFALLLALSMFCALLAGCGKKEETDNVTVRVGAMSGPTAMGMVKLMKDAEDGTAKGTYEFADLSTDPSTFVAPLTKGDIDIAAVPSNLASVIYNNTNGGVQILAVNTLGVLNIVERGDSVQSIKENAAELFSGIRHIAINILTNDKVFKAGLRRKMRKAAMDRNYLASVLAGSGLS